MTFFYLTNFSYVKTVLTIWSVSQFAIFKNMHVFADPITYVLQLLLYEVFTSFPTFFNIFIYFCLLKLGEMEMMFVAIIT